MNLKKLVLSALFIALSFVGANVKIMGSIAFDSMSAYLGAVLLGPYYGVTIGFLGHCFTALLSGFPFGLLLHVIIASSMAVTMFCFAASFYVLKGKVPLWLNCIITAIVGIVLNGPATLAVLIPFLGYPVALGMLPLLTYASAFNIALALFVYINVIVKSLSTVETNTRK